MKLKMRNLNDNTIMVKQETKEIKSTVLKIDDKMTQYHEEMQNIKNWLKVKINNNLIFCKISCYFDIHTLLFFTS